MKLFGNKKEGTGDKSSSPVASEKTKSSASFLKRTVSKIGSLFSKTNTENTAEPMSNAEYLGEIYKLMVQNSVDIKLEREQQVNFREEEDSEEQKRHSEIIKALTIRRRPKPKAVIRREKKATEKAAPPAPSIPGKPGKPGKPSAPSKPTETKPPQPSQPSKPAEPSKPAQKPAETKPAQPSKPAEPVKSAETKPAQKPVEPAKPAQKPAEPAKPAQKPAEPAKPAQKPAEPAKPAQKPAEPAKPKTAEPVKEAPKQPAAKPAETVKPPEPVKPPTATQKPPSTAKPGAATAAKVAKEAPFLYAATQNTKFMAGLGVLSTKYNSTVPDLLSFMMNESGLNPAAHNKNGGASGLIQIMPSTLKGMKERGYKSVKDINTVDDLRKLSAEEQLPIIDDYFNYTQLEKSAKVAKEQGRNVDLATLYSAVFLPAFKDKPNDFIMGIKPGETVNGKKSTDILYGKTTYGTVYLSNNAFDKGSKVTKKDAKGKPLEVEGGKGYFNKGDIGIKAGKFNDLVSQSLSVNNSGSKIDQSSKDNKDMKSQEKSSPPPIQQNTTNVNNTTESSNTPKVDDRPAHQRK